MITANGSLLRRPATALFGVILVGLVLLAAGPPASAAATGTSAAAVHPRCSSYPAPGQLAPAGAKVPTTITRNYSLFRGRRTAQDRLDLKKLQSPLEASGIVTAGIRYLGRTPEGYKLYAVPARHYTPWEIAPLRCFAANQRAVETELLPSLKRDYTHTAICIVETGVNPVDGVPLENCGAPQNIADAMVATNGLPLLGLAPNSVTSVQATYLDSPARIIRVKHNFYKITGGASAVVPCGVTWLQDSGNTAAATFNGCDYETNELPEYEQYQAFVTTQFAVVQNDVNALSTAITSGDLKSAQAAWLTAHLAWLLLGQDDKQYGAFGNLGNSIDGTSAGLVGGETSTDFTGFHKIELDLWGSGGLSAAAADTTTLQTLLKQLVATPIKTELPDTFQGVGNWLLRPHEILEDAERDTLTGDDDYGSGTGAAAITADVSAAKEDLSLLAPTLDPLAPKLITTIDAELKTVDAAAEVADVNGQWVGIAALPTTEREQLDAAVGAAVETLSLVPDLLTSTGKAAPPI